MYCRVEKEKKNPPIDAQFFVPSTMASEVLEYNAQAVWATFAIFGSYYK